MSHLSHKQVNGVIILEGMKRGEDTGETLLSHCISCCEASITTPIIFLGKDKYWWRLVHDGNTFQKFECLNSLVEDEAVLLVQDPSYDSAADFWKIQKIEDQKRRAINRFEGQQFLIDNGIKFVSKNGGAHLIIGDPSVINFWPGTQRWTHVKNSSINGRGTKSLLTWINANQPTLKG